MAMKKRKGKNKNVNTRAVHNINLVRPMETKKFSGLTVTENNTQPLRNDFLSTLLRKYLRKGSQN